MHLKFLCCFQGQDLCDLFYYLFHLIIIVVNVYMYVHACLYVHDVLS